MRGYWFHRTRWGVFYIRQDRAGRWHAMFGDESLGSYYDPRQALDDLVGGHTVFPSNGLDPSEARLPDELTEWTFVRTA